MQVLVDTPLGDEVMFLHHEPAPRIRIGERSKSRRPRRHKRLGPSFQCNCGAVVPYAHWLDHLNKGDHAEKVKRFREQQVHVGWMCRKK